MRARGPNHPSFAAWRWHQIRVGPLANRFTAPTNRLQHVVVCGSVIQCGHGFQMVSDLQFTA